MKKGILYFKTCDIILHSFASISVVSVRENLAQQFNREKCYNIIAYAVSTKCNLNNIEAVAI